MNTALLFVLLVLTVYRLTRLITTDDFPPVLWVRDRLAGGWRPLTMSENRAYSNAKALNDPEGPSFVTTEINGVTHRWVNRSDWSPDWLAELITCPWCASGWASSAVVLATDLTVGLPVPWLYGVAVWGAAALLASRKWA